MRPKLYLAVDTITVMFLCEEGKDLYEAARRFADEEHKHYVPGRLAIKEIKSIDEIPEEWSGSQLLWGIDDEITARDFIKDPEYEEYKRLKEKFEK
jgi:hypothetical protein